MLREKIKGITFAALRPLKHGADESAGARRVFPVYPDLVEELRRATGPDARTAHILAVMSGWAYSDARTLSAMMVRLGLEKNRCRYLEISNNAMFIRSSAYLLQSECGRVALLAYRGTDPFDLSTWAADADVHPVMIPVPGAAPPKEGLTDKILGGVFGHASVPQVHGGFYRNQRATWFDVLQGLDRALAGQSILEDAPAANAAGATLTPEGTENDTAPSHPLEALYITGHSLGGAMATLAAYKIATDPAYAALNDKLRGVYTYGSPMVGNEAFAALWKQRNVLENRLFGHVYASDVVPHLPPGSAGDFAHVGRVFASVPRNEGPARPKFKWAENDRSVTQVESLGALLSAVVPLVAEQIPGLKLATDIARRVPFVASHGLGYSFYDHSPTLYIECSKKNEQLTEFGDDF